MGNIFNWAALLIITDQWNHLDFRLKREATEAKHKQQSDDYTCLHTRGHTDTYPAQNDIDLHSQQESIQQHQQSSDAVAQLPGADAMLSVLGKLNDLHGEGQHPIDQQG